MSGQSQQQRLPSIRDLQATSGSTSHQASNIILPPLTPPVIDSQPSSSSSSMQHPLPQRTQRPVEVDLSEVSQKTIVNSKHHYVISTRFFSFQGY